VAVGTPGYPSVAVARGGEVGNGPLVAVLGGLTGTGVFVGCPGEVAVDPIVGWGVVVAVGMIVEGNVPTGVDVPVPGGRIGAVPNGVCVGIIVGWVVPSIGG